MLEEGRLASEEAELGMEESALEETEGPPQLSKMEERANRATGPVFFVHMQLILFS